MHTVELLPDPATERAVRDVWRRLLDLGLPSQATHRHPTNRPHPTLATAGAPTSEVRGRLRRELAFLPLPLHLDGLVRFTGRTRVLAWAVRPDDVLPRLYERVWRTLRDAPESGRLNRLHDPARWIPHITLGRGRDPVWRGPQDGLIQQTAAPSGVLAGRWEAARRYDSLIPDDRPHRPLTSVARTGRCRRRGRAREAGADVAAEDRLPGPSSGRGGWAGERVPDGEEGGHLIGGRYDETRGGRPHACQGQFWIDGDGIGHLGHLDDLGDALRPCGVRRRPAAATWPAVTEVEGA